MDHNTFIFRNLSHTRDSRVITYKTCNADMVLVIPDEHNIAKRPIILRLIAVMYASGNISSESHVCSEYSILYIRFVMNFSLFFYTTREQIITVSHVQNTFVLMKCLQLSWIAVIVRNTRVLTTGNNIIWTNDVIV